MRTTKTILSCDICNAEFDERPNAEKPGRLLLFSVEGVRYQMDLCNEHHGEFSETISVWCERASEVQDVRTPVRTSIPGRTGRPSRRDPEVVNAIRTWANANGFDVKDRGRIPRAVEDAYNARAKKVA